MHDYVCSIVEIHIGPELMRIKNRGQIGAQNNETTIAGYDNSETSQVTRENVRNHIYPIRSTFSRYKSRSNSKKKHHKHAYVLYCLPCFQTRAEGWSRRSGSAALQGLGIEEPAKSTFCGQSTAEPVGVRIRTGERNEMVSG